jgi:hypothetical protein
MEIAARVIAIAGVAVFTLWLVWALMFRDGRKVYLKLRKLPERTVATLIVGQPACVVGRARAVKLTQALYSKRPCILYSLRLADTTMGHDATAVGEDFELEDATGCVLVSGRGTYEVDLVEKPTGNIQAQGFGASSIARNLRNLDSQTTQDEGVLPDGAAVAVGGLVAKGDDGKLCIVSTPGSPVFVVDVRRHKALAKRV